MKIDVVNYLIDLNPCKPIWLHSNESSKVSVSGPPCAHPLLWMGSPFVLMDLGPSVPYQPFSSLSITSPGLDCPPLSPVTLNLPVSCITPSPSFDLPSPNTTLHPISFVPPSLVGFVPVVDLPIHNSISSTLLNPPTDQGSHLYLLATLTFCSSTLRLVPPSHKRITKVHGIPFGTIRQHLDLARPRRISTSMHLVRTSPFVLVKMLIWVRWWTQ